MPVDTATLMQQVARIRMVTRRLVDDRFCGEYHSVFKGRGIEFDEVRPYAFGDDVRSIDWNVTARTGEPHLKRYAEERELTVIFMVDVSGSQCFGSGDRDKAERAAEVTGVLALSALRNQDKVGLVLFSDRIHLYLPPRKGRTAVMRLVREVLAAEATRQGTDIQAALQFLSAVHKRRAIVFLLSDFQANGYESALRNCARRHDLVACPISDPREAELPSIGLVQLEDPETGETRLVDCASRALREAYARQTRDEREALESLLRRHAVDAVYLDTRRPFIADLRRLFERRLRRGGRRRR